MVIILFGGHYIIWWYGQKLPFKTKVDRLKFAILINAPKVNNVMDLILAVLKPVTKLPTFQLYSMPLISHDMNYPITIYGSDLMTQIVHSFVCDRSHNTTYVLE